MNLTFDTSAWLRTFRGCFQRLCEVDQGQQRDEAQPCPYRKETIIEDVSFSNFETEGFSDNGDYCASPHVSM